MVALGQAELAEDVAYVGLDGLDAEVELGRDTGIRVPLGNQGEDIELAEGEAKKGLPRRTFGKGNH